VKKFKINNCKIEEETCGSDCSEIWRDVRVMLEICDIDEFFLCCIVSSTIYVSLEIRHRYVEFYNHYHSYEINFVIYQKCHQIHKIK
jgi:hypothetical protein